MPYYEASRLANADDKGGSNTRLIHFAIIGQSQAGGFNSTPSLTLSGNDDVGS